MDAIGGLRRAMGAIVVTAAVTTACGDDNGEVFRGVSTTTSEPPVSEPGGESTLTDLDELTDELKILVQNAHALRFAVSQAPETIHNRDDPEVATLWNLHTSNSPRMNELFGEFEDLAESGHRAEIAMQFPPGLVDIAHVELLNADTVLFQYCFPFDYAVVDEDGESIEVRAGSELGDGEARRVGEQWRIHRMVPFHTGSITPGQVHHVAECRDHRLELWPTRAEREAQEEEAAEE